MITNHVLNRLPIFVVAAAGMLPADAVAQQPPDEIPPFIRQHSSARKPPTDTCPEGFYSVTQLVGGRVAFDEVVAAEIAQQESIQVCEPMDRVVRQANKFIDHVNQQRKEVWEREQQPRRSEPSRDIIPDRPGGGGGGGLSDWSRGRQIPVTYPSGTRPSVTKPDSPIPYSWGLEVGSDGSFERFSGSGFLPRERDQPPLRAK